MILTPCSLRSELAPDQRLPRYWDHYKIMWLVFFPHNKLNSVSLWLLNNFAYIEVLWLDCFLFTRLLFCIDLECSFQQQCPSPLLHNDSDGSHYILCIALFDTENCCLVLLHVSTVSLCSWIKIAGDGIKAVGIFLMGRGLQVKTVKGSYWWKPWSQAFSLVPTLC